MPSSAIKVWLQELFHTSSIGTSIMLVLSRPEGIATLQQPLPEHESLTTDSALSQIDIHTAVRSSSLWFRPNRPAKMLHPTTKNLLRDCDIAIPG